MTVYEAVLEVVNKDPRYDGLVQGEGECACRSDDLMPCDQSEIANCNLGYAVKPSEDSDGDCCHPEVCDWHIVPGPRPGVAP